MSQVQNIFFAKEGIAELNKQLLNTFELPNLVQEGRKEIINVLLKNMKSVYKTIDVSKINNNNVNSILEQFKKHSVHLAKNEINSQGLLSKYQDASSLKFNRDFNSKPNNGVIYVDRPVSSKLNPSQQQYDGFIQTNKVPQQMPSQQQKPQQMQPQMSQQRNPPQMSQQRKPQQMSQQMQPQMSQQRNPQQMSQQMQPQMSQQRNPQQMQPQMSQQRNPQQMQPQMSQQRNQPQITQQIPTQQNTVRQMQPPNMGQQLQKQYDMLPQPTRQQHKQPMDNSSLNYTSSLDSAFKPIINDISDEMKNYEKSAGTNIAAKLDDIQSSRNNEVSSRNMRPSTPDFLKSTKTNGSRNQDLQQKFDNNPNKQQISKNDKNDTNDNYFGLANDISGDLFSLDNIDKPLIQTEYVEDNSNFDERLSRLNSERSHISIPNTGNVDFTSDSFKSNQQINDNSVPVLQNNAVRRNVDLPQPRNAPQSQRVANHQLARDDSQEIKQRNKEIQEMQEQEQRRKTKEAEIQKQKQKERDIELQMKKQKEQKMQEIQKRKQNVQNDNLVTVPSMKKSNNNLNNYIKKKVTIEEDITPTNYIDYNVSETYDIQAESNNESSQMETPANNNFGLYDIKAKELELRELEIETKNAELEKLINNYKYLFNSQYIHVEVTDSQNRSAYNFPLNNINNVISIKLNHYSLPNIQFNIEENKNNALIIKKDNIEMKILINKGKYTIDSLLDALNSKLDNIKLSLTQEQTIKIESLNDSKFDLLPTLLSTNNLGFTSDSTNNTSYIADNIWDLRIDNKVYLYITNLSNNVPFGILFNHGNSHCEFKFKEPFDIDSLDIVFKDSKGNNYNFYNLEHSLSFMIQTN